MADVNPRFLASSSCHNNPSKTSIIAEFKLDWESTPIRWSKLNVNLVEKIISKPEDQWVKHDFYLHRTDKSLTTFSTDNLGTLCLRWKPEQLLNWCSCFEHFVWCVFDYGSSLDTAAFDNVYADLFVSAICADNMEVLLQITRVNSNRGGKPRFFDF